VEGDRPPFPSQRPFATLSRKRLAEVRAACGPKVKIFCDMVGDLLSHENLRSTFDFYVGSFSRERDDLEA
jgi:hypothetical protein